MTTAVDLPLLVVIVLAALLVGALLGFLVAQIRAGRQIETVRIELEAARVRLESNARQEADRLSLLEQSESRLREAFDSLAGETLRSNSELFLRLAREALGRDQAIAQSSLMERETAIAQLIEPIRSALQKTEAQVEALERDRRDAFASLRTQIETLSQGQNQLQRETRNLVTALRRPEVRGRWGELTLRRLVELAGMSEHCDFTEQLSIPGIEGSLRPDMVVHMPESRDIVVDVKAPLDAYLEALEAATDEQRQLALKRHGQQVEARVRQLSGKSYWAQFEHSPEFVVLFLPGDQFLSAALAERPELLESALKQNVILATPSTLIALLKTVAYGWRQAAVAENAAVIRGLGQELYRRLGNFTAHIGRMGQRLGSAVEAYNAAVGSLERQVMPQARRFTELGVTSDAPLPELEQVDMVPRSLTSQVSMELGSAGSAPPAPRSAGSGKSAAGSGKSAPSSATLAPGEASTAAGSSTSTPESASAAAGKAKSTPASASRTEGSAMSPPGLASAASGSATSASESASTAAGKAKSTLASASTTEGSATSTPELASAASGLATSGPRSASAGGPATSASGEASTAAGPGASAASRSRTPDGGRSA